MGSKFNSNKYMKYALLTEATNPRISPVQRVKALMKLHYGDDNITPRRLISLSKKLKVNIPVQITSKTLDDAIISFAQAFLQLHRQKTNAPIKNVKNKTRKRKTRRRKKAKATKPASKFDELLAMPLDELKKLTKNKVELPNISDEAELHYLLARAFAILKGWL